MVKGAKNAVWTETWEVAYFGTILPNLSDTPPANHDCVGKLGLMEHSGRIDAIAQARRGFGGGHGVPLNECECFRHPGPGIQTGSGAANLTLETGQAFKVLWFSRRNIHRTPIRLKIAQWRFTHQYR